MSPYNRQTVLRFLLIGVLAGSTAVVALADVSLNGVFADHMVLQRNARVPIWGNAAPGEAVTVAVAGKEAKTTARPDGAWRVTLESLPAGGPYTLAVTGRNHIALQDVLVGDVWLCSGQSNMAFTMHALRDGPYADDLKTADFPTIRQGLVPRHPSTEALASTPVTWTACTPTTVDDFTAVGFYFAREVQKQIKVPIGLLHASWGGTSAESWTSKAALDTVPDFKTRADAQLANLAALPDQIKAFPAAIAAWDSKYGRTDPGSTGEAQGWAAPVLAPADTAAWKPSTLGARWREDGLPDGGIIWVRKELTVPPDAAGKGFRIDLGSLTEMHTTSYFNGVKIGESGSRPPTFDTGYVNYDVPGTLVKPGLNVFAVRYVSAVGSRAPTQRLARAMGFAAVGVPDPGDDCLVRIEKAFPPLTAAALAERPATPSGDAPHTSSALFGGMISPLIPFAIKGALWYQGEQDGSRGYAYRTLLPLMIRDWRTRWGEGDFPFYIQQLPDWQPVQAQPSESAWAELREAQAMTAHSLPNVGIAVAIDIGEVDNVHPHNKREVGRRLALAALAQTYGLPLPFSGPVYQSMSVEGSAIRIRLTHNDGLRSADGGPLKQFAVAGEDHKWVWADARIDGDTVLVSSAAVARPVAVRYAWANSPVGCNLTNASGLPAIPFRTDDWPIASQNRK